MLILPVRYFADNGIGVRIMFLQDQLYLERMSLERIDQRYIPVGRIADLRQREMHHAFPCYLKKKGVFSN
jgi:hypothetical protein